MLNNNNNKSAKLTILLLKGYVPEKIVGGGSLKKKPTSFPCFEFSDISDTPFHFEIATPPLFFFQSLSYPMILNGIDLKGYSIFDLKDEDDLVKCHRNIGQF